MLPGYDHPTDEDRCALLAKEDQNGLQPATNCEIHKEEENRSQRGHDKHHARGQQNLTPRRPDNLRDFAPDLLDKLQRIHRFCHSSHLIGLFTSGADTAFEASIQVGSDHEIAAMADRPTLSGTPKPFFASPAKAMRRAMSRFRAPRSTSPRRDTG